MLITFSGLDGAGKSTLIALLVEWMEARGGVVAVRSTYYHVGVYATIRRIRDTAKWHLARVRGRAVDTELKTTDPDRLGLARQQHGRVLRMLFRVVRSQGFKRAVLFLDLPILMVARAWFGRSRKHILIMDRYIYDSLADASDGQRWVFVRFFLRLVPSPDCAVFLDVRPEEALRRKGEYSAEYNKIRRQKYEGIFKCVPTSVRLQNDLLIDTAEALFAEVSSRWPTATRK